MFSFLTKFRSKQAESPPYCPTGAELREALEHGAKTPEMVAYLERRREREVAERDASRALRQQQLAGREVAVASLQKPGELWLHTEAGPKRALARYARQQGAVNDNKLVLGPAGSGRSLLLGRLAKTASEAGGCVVVLDSFGVNLNNPGPLWMLTFSQGGTFASLDRPGQLSFNPFWMPDAGYSGWRMPQAPARLPTGEEMQAIALLLANLLRLSRYDAPVTEEKVQGWLYDAVAAYYASPEMQASDHNPCFKAFVNVVLALPRTGEVEWLNAEFIDWLTQVSQPYREGGELEALLDASHFQAQAAFARPGQGMTYIDFGLDASAASAADTPEFKQAPWGNPAAQAQTRVLMLLLHTLDFRMGQREQRLTIVADELHYDSLGSRMATYLAGYLGRGPQYNRELVVGWHESPATVFQEQHPAARTILAHCGTHILLAGTLSHFDKAAKYAPLDLTEEETDTLTGLSCGTRELMVRRPGQACEVFSAQLAYVNLTDFVPQKWLLRMAAS